MTEDRGVIVRSALTGSATHSRSNNGVISSMSGSTDMSPLKLSKLKSKMFKVKNNAPKFVHHNQPHSDMT